MTIREKETKKRFEDYHECVVLLRSFYDAGFKTFQAFKTIVNHYDNDVDEYKLHQIWRLKGIDENTKLKLDVIFSKLKGE